MRGKNQCGAIVLVMVVGLLVGGCSSFTFTYPTEGVDLGMFDSGIPEDQSCLLGITGGLKVVGFNGATVNWGDYNWRAMQHGNNWVSKIRIPSGEHTLKVDLELWPYTDEGGKISSGKITGNFTVRHTFEPGHSYILSPIFDQPKMLTNAYTNGIHIYSGSMATRDDIQMKVALKKKDAIKLIVTDVTETP